MRLRPGLESVHPTLRPVHPIGLQVADDVRLHIALQGADEGP